MRYTIILFYKYIHIDDPEAVAKREREICARLGLKGRCIIASEGINATYEGTKENIEKYVKELEKDTRFQGIHFKYSSGNGKAFPKLSIKVRKEIVSLHLGTCDIDPNQVTGIHLKPEELHEWLAPSKVEGVKNKKEFYIVDMRNVYEHKGGHCEKASGYLITQGFKNVYQLYGGIVSYMEKYPNEDFQGKLYVFDTRVTMGFYTDNVKHKIVGKCDSCSEPT